MALPNFLICGAEKAGTTALYNYVKKHPNVFFSEPKETFFFNRKFDKGVEWFKKHFESYGGEKAIGEGTATTIYSSKAPHRIREVLDSPRLIFVLRDPIERAYSQYFYYLQRGKISPDLSFIQALEKNEWGILDKGKYIQFIHRFDRVDEFSIHIILNKKLKKDPGNVLGELFSFLKVDEEFRPEIGKRYNVTRYPRSREIYHWIRRGWHTVRDSVEPIFPTTIDVVRQGMRKILFDTEKPAMTEEARAYLREFYAESNARLEEYIDQDLSHWE